MNRVKFLDEKIELAENLREVLWKMKWQELDNTQGRHHLDQGTPERRLSWDAGLKQYKQLLLSLEVSQ